jgi:hypothetical protein
MRTILMQPRRVPGMIAAAIVLLCCLSQFAVAADARLAIRQTNGLDVFYTLNEIEEITSEANELYVTTVGGTDIYVLSAIVRIDFILDATTGIDGPGNPPISINASHLFQNYPNPFSPETRIAFDLPAAGLVEIRIYDVTGRLIRTLVDEKRPTGFHSLKWDGRDNAGRAVASGTYFYKLTAPEVKESRKMILLR